MTWIRRTYQSPAWKLAEELAPWFVVGLGMGAAIDIITRFI